MKILIVPMFALSSMNGPWSRAVIIANAFEAAGHHVVLGCAEDGNCRADCGIRTLDLPVPSPLGAPMAIAKRTFPLAQKLGIAGRKPVTSFEEVLWLTGNLAYPYLKESVSRLRSFIVEEAIDAVYSEFSLSAVIAALAEGIPLYGSASYPTRADYAAAPEKAKGIRRLLGELDLASVDSSLELFARMNVCFVPSCHELEPWSEEGVLFCGFLTPPPRFEEQERNALVIYPGTGSVPIRNAIDTAAALVNETGLEVYLAGVDYPDTDAVPGLNVAPRFDFSELLPRAVAFVHHGGQNSMMDALRYGVPQIIYPGKVFERRYNAESIRKAHAGSVIDDFTAASIRTALRAMAFDESIRRNAADLRDCLASLGGTARIVETVGEQIGE